MRKVGLNCNCWKKKKKNKTQSELHLLCMCFITELKRIYTSSLLQPRFSSSFYLNQSFFSLSLNLYRFFFLSHQSYCKILVRWKSNVKLKREEQRTNTFIPCFEGEFYTLFYTCMSWVQLLVWVIKWTCEFGSRIFMWDIRLHKLSKLI